MPEDKLTCTIRLHDPAEKKDAKKSTAWIAADIPRADLSLPLDEFCERYAKPMIKQGLAQLFRPVASSTLADLSATSSDQAASAAVPGASIPETSSPSVAAPGDTQPSVAGQASADDQQTQNADLNKSSHTPQHATDRNLPDAGETPR
jgi:hypothetical protein